MRQPRVRCILMAAFVAVLGVTALPAVAGAGPAKPTVAVQPAMAQYSDFVMLRARISPAPTAGTAVFTVNGSSDGLVGSAGYNRRTGMATQLYRVPLPEGTYEITVLFSGPPRPPYTARGCGLLTVKPEDARVVFSSTDGSPLPWLRTYNSAESSTCAPFSFKYEFVEVPDGTPGDLSLAHKAWQRQYQIFAEPLAAPLSGRSSATAMPGEQIDAVNGASPGTYMFQASLHAYYRAHGEYAFAVYDPEAGMSAGAGSFINPTDGSWASFAFVYQHGDESHGILAYQQTIDDRQNQFQRGDYEATFSYSPGSAQMTLGGILMAVTEALPDVPGSRNTVAIDWAPGASLADFGPTVLTQGAIDLNEPAD